MPALRGGEEELSGWNRRESDQVSLVDSIKDLLAKIRRHE